MIPRCVFTLAVMMGAAACGPDDPGSPCEEGSARCDGNAAETCSGGVWIERARCDQPLASECVDAVTLRSWAGGGCEEGECAYEAVDEACDAPPSPGCDGTDLRTWSGGACEAGECRYELETVDCGADGCCEDRCCDGSCGACTDPWPPECADAATARRYLAPGTCGDDGECVYEAVDEACDAPPGPGCDGTVLQTWSGGACEAGECRYELETVDCGADGCCEDRCCDPACVPECEGRACGPDGCGRECGSCAGDEICSVTGACVPGGEALDCRGYSSCYDGCLGIEYRAEWEACIALCDATIDEAGYEMFWAAIDCLIDFDCAGETVGHLMSCSASHCATLLRACFPQDAAPGSCSRALGCIDPCDPSAFSCYFECVVGTRDEDLGAMSAYLDCLRSVDYCSGLSGAEYVTCMAPCQDEGDACTGEPETEESYSCAGSCGSVAPGGCSCEEACALAGDCCADYAEVCLSDLTDSLSCEGRCGGTAPGGCACAAGCLDDASCCFDFLTACGTVEDLYSCEGRCDERAAGGCWCDASCVVEGDCCLDYLEHCSESLAESLSCEGRCGGMAPGGCGCDSSCLTSGDCCLDYLTVCTSSSRDCDAELDECIDDCLIWALFGGYEVCVEDCSQEYIWCEAIT